MKGDTMDMRMRVIQAELLDGEEDREPSNIVWGTGEDQAEQDNKNSNEMTKVVEKDIREYKVYQMNNKETKDKEDIGAWDTEDKEIDEDDEKATKGSTVA
jgi:curli biogenesis system outer membrane secretion channel CsgG